MTRVVGALLLVAAAASAAIGGLWAFLKAVGNEYDYCRTGGDGCISGYLGAAAFLGLAAILALVGLTLLRAARDGEPRRLSRRR